jgi:hypothetical protein
MKPADVEVTQENGQPRLNIYEDKAGGRQSELGKKYHQPHPGQRDVGNPDILVAKIKL